MIVYDYRSGFGLELMLHSAGSALFNIRTILPGCISAGIALLAALEPEIQKYLVETLRNPAVYFSGVAFLISFVVVFRSQLAYGRFFGALTSYFRMKARLMDIATVTKALVLPNTPNAVLLKSTIFRWVRLYHKLALTRLRGGPVEDMDLEELIQAKEVEILLVTRAKNQMVASWITRAVSENIHEFTAPAPIIGRLYQLAADAEMEFGGALQVAETPFPFPYAQITVVLLNIWLVTTPLFMTPFVMESPFLAVFLAFISSWIIFAVNESAANLESPFDGDDNDIPLTYFDVVFDNALSSVQFSPDPVFFRNESKCYIGTTASKEQRRYIKTRVVRVGSVIDDINNGVNAADSLNRALNIEQRKGNIFARCFSACFRSKVNRSLKGDLVAKEMEVRDSKESTNVSKPETERMSKRRSSGRRKSARKSAADATTIPDDVVINVEDNANQGSVNTLSLPQDEDPRVEEFASPTIVSLLFSPETNTAIQVPWRDRLPHVFCHNPISRMFARSKRSLRDIIKDRVDSGTMRAQGSFTKYT